MGWDALPYYHLMIRGLSGPMGRYSRQVRGSHPKTIGEHVERRRHGLKQKEATARLDQFLVIWTR